MVWVSPAAFIVKSVVLRVRPSGSLDAVSYLLAAGAVVVGDVEPNTVVAGCPARVIKRKDEKTAAKTALIDALRTL